MYFTAGALKSTRCVLLWSNILHILGLILTLAATATAATTAIGFVVAWGKGCQRRGGFVAPKWIQRFFSKPGERWRCDSTNDLSVVVLKQPITIRSFHHSLWGADAAYYSSSNHSIIYELKSTFTSYFVLLIMTEGQEKF